MRSRVLFLLFKNNHQSDDSSGYYLIHMYYTQTHVAKCKYMTWIMELSTEHTLIKDRIWS